MRRVALALLALAGAAEAFVAPQPTAAPLTVVAGRNDKRTKKGKVYAGSNGKSRPRKPGGEKGPVDPCRGGVRLLFHRPIGATVARQIPVLKVTCSNHVSVTGTLPHPISGTTHRYLTLREWGARQDPAMSVEEVVAAKMADKRKVEITLEDIMDAVTPF